VDLQQVRDALDDIERGGYHLLVVATLHQGAHIRPVLAAHAVTNVARHPAKCFGSAVLAK